MPEGVITPTHNPQIVNLTRTPRIEDRPSVDKVVGVVFNSIRAQHLRFDLFALADARHRPLYERTQVR